MLPKDQDLHNLHTPDPRQPAKPTTQERVEFLEKRLDFLENTIMSAIRDLSVNVNQMHRTQLSALGHLNHDHDHQAPPAPQIMFTFLEALSVNSMYRVYLDGPDHPICPNQLNIHTRRDGEDVFDSAPVEPIMVELLTREFAAQVGQVPNKVYFVEVHRLTDEPVDETSVAVVEQSE
jgi:hypothetical protein